MSEFLTVQELTEKIESLQTEMDLLTKLRDDFIDRGWYK